MNDMNTDGRREYDYRGGNYRDDYRDEDRYGGESKYQYRREYFQGRPNYGRNEERYNNANSSNVYNRYEDERETGGFSSQYQYSDEDSEYEVVVCPVHGKKTLKRRRDNVIY